MGHVFRQYARQHILFRNGLEQLDCRVLPSQGELHATRALSLGSQLEYGNRYMYVCTDSKKRGYPH